MTDRKKRIWTYLVSIGLVGVAVTLALWWWSNNAPFKEGIIFDPIEKPSSSVIDKTP